MEEIRTQIDTGKLTLGEITHGQDLRRNFAENAVPQDLDTVTAGSYFDFLIRRRVIMAQIIRAYNDAL